jgi:hypothetical protein
MISHSVATVELVLYSFRNNGIDLHLHVRRHIPHLIDINSTEIATTTAIHQERRRALGNSGPEGKHVLQVEKQVIHVRRLDEDILFTLLAELSKPMSIDDRVINGR